MQASSSFAPWKSPDDPTYSLFLITDGVVSAEDMLLAAQNESLLGTWYILIMNK